MYITIPEDRSGVLRASAANAAKATRSASQRIRSLILSVASEAFASKGFAATTTGDIAVLAGLPKANVHYHFGSKKTLYEHVLAVVCAPYLDAFALLQAEDEPQKALPAYIRALVRIIQAEPCASTVFATELIHGARCTVPSKSVQG